jgi:hypothetical protein
MRVKMLGVTRTELVVVPMHSQDSSSALWNTGSNKKNGPPPPILNWYHRLMQGLVTTYGSK